MNSLRKFKTPGYIFNLIGGYLSSRSLSVETAKGARMKKVTAGGAQGLVHRLREPSEDSLPHGAIIIVHADDSLAMIGARSLEVARETLKGVRY